MRCVRICLRLRHGVGLLMLLLKCCDGRLVHALCGRRSCGDVLIASCIVQHGIQCLWTSLVTKVSCSGKEDLA